MTERSSHAKEQINVPLYESTTRISKVSGHERRAELPTGEQIRMGVHGAIARHFKLPLDQPLPLPVDYIVAATGG